MIRLITYVHENRERGFSLCIKLGLHKNVFILTFMNEIPTPFFSYVFCSNMNHILRQPWLKATQNSFAIVFLLQKLK